MTELDMFTEVLNRTNLAEPAAFLDQACAGNPDLRRRLEELPAGQARSGSPLDRPPLTPEESSETVDLAMAQVAAEYRSDQRMDTLGHVDSIATTDVQRAPQRPSTNLIGEVQPDRAATVDHADADATVSVP
ncbi:MAG: hypothetical protein KGM43_11065 [Planctomycetota bacterium]|nr:hypothetical protein [Planctomycetota bacterium]